MKYRCWKQFPFIFLSTSMFVTLAGTKQKGEIKKSDVQSIFPSQQLFFSLFPVYHGPSSIQNGTLWVPHGNDIWYHLVSDTGNFSLHFRPVCDSGLLWGMDVWWVDLLRVRHPDHYWLWGFSCWWVANWFFNFTEFPRMFKECNSKGPK